MRLLPLGIGNAFSIKYNNTSFLVETDKKYLIDVPKNLRKTLDKYSVDIKDINDVIITHYHADHLGDLEQFLQYKRWVENEKPTIYTKQEIFDVIEPFYSKIFDNKVSDNGKRLEKQYLSEIFDYIELNPEHPLLNGGTKIEIKDTFHTVPTFSVKLTYSKRSLANSSDTNFNPDLLNNFLSGSDFIIHEACSYEDPVHTYVKTLEEYVEKNKINNIHLAHIDDNLESSLPILKEGKWYDV